MRYQAMKLPSHPASLWADALALALAVSLPLFMPNGYVALIGEKFGLLLACTFGCPVCIDEELLERQSMHQVGETSYSMPANSVSTEALQGALQQAIREENYELAAQLRDELLRRK